MQSLTILLATLILAITFVPSNASAATRMTEQQVRNVCGSGLQSSGGAIGCFKKCRNTVCDYGCYKNQCYGISFRLKADMPSRPPMDMHSLASSSDSDAPHADGPALP